jgi:hypothetical protein
VTLVAVNFLVLRNLFWKSRNSQSDIQIQTRGHLGNAVLRKDSSAHIERKLNQVRDSVWVVTYLQLLPYLLLITTHYNRASKSPREQTETLKCLKSCQVSQIFVPIKLCYLGFTMSIIVHMWSSGTGPTVYICHTTRSLMTYVLSLKRQLKRHLKRRKYESGVCLSPSPAAVLKLRWVCPKRVLLCFTRYDKLSHWILAWLLTRLNHCKLSLWSGVAQTLAMTMCVETSHLSLGYWNQGSTHSNSSSSPGKSSTTLRSVKSCFYIVCVCLLMLGLHLFCVP